MKQKLIKLKIKVVKQLEACLLGIIYLHDMGLPPAEADAIFHMIHPGQEEARQMATIARHKYQEPKGETIIKKA